MIKDALPYACFSIESLKETKAEAGKDCPDNATHEFFAKLINIFLENEKHNNRYFLDSIQSMIQIIFK